MAPCLSNYLFFKSMTIETKKKKKKRRRRRSRRNDDDDDVIEDKRESTKEREKTNKTKMRKSKEINVPFRPFILSVTLSIRHST